MKDLIIKYLSNEISSSELDTLILWLQDPKNQKKFDFYVKTSHDIRLSKTNLDLDAQYNQVMKTLESKNQPAVKPLWKRIYKYAALLILALCVGFLLKTQFNSNFNTLTPGNESITLELDNGQIHIYNPDKPEDITDAEGNLVAVEQGNSLNYQQNAAVTHLEYNTINIPYGKKLEVTLSDGTTVFLNAGSSLRFPVKFMPTGKREVFLSGEAYFDVTKNKDQPFIVSASELDVTVLGTKFNVSAYKEDQTTAVVLVEGAVALNSQETENKTLLNPGYKGALNKQDASKTISVSKVNTAIYTSWMQDRLVFRDMPFENITKKLERQYNVVISVEDDILKKEPFSATLDYENIETVLSYFKDLYNMNYRIENNTIYINQAKN
ncbi:FecR family protein [Formosa sp. S-31]|uniref:FecR family protein n=1 Tax=Formosa sp. S-31 TaxID=2790949 RepID=UPI003EBFB41E